MAKTLVIRELTRKPKHGREDAISFERGVNVLVGPPNTGKTKWLRMLDYLLGDDGKPEDAFGDDLAEKYDSAQVKVAIADEEFCIERRWKEANVKTKIFVGDDAHTVAAFRQWLMEKLEIPLLHYPQGNPYGPRTWPELGWRSLYRHMYRRQIFWADLADQQPESEQHACLMQFLGLAKHLFSEEYGSLVTKEKKILELQYRKEQFLTMLQEVSKELVSESGLGVGLTPQSIDMAEQRIRGEVEAAKACRHAALAEVMNAAVGGRPSAQEAAERRDVVERMGEALARLQAEQEATLASGARTESRLTEMEEYRRLVEEEISRMKRARAAGSLLGDLKITHCPACDRAIDPPVSGIPSCYLCGRPNSDRAEAERAAEKRLDFELEQLNGDLRETEELLDALRQDLSRLRTARARIAEEIARVQSKLQPVRAAAAFVIPPELSIYDQEIGGLHERLQQVGRIRASLGRRETLAEEINQIQQEVAALENEVHQQSGRLDFERASDRLQDGMVTYLNAIRGLNPHSWNQESVNVRLQERGFSIKVGKGNWKAKLGGTLTLYFLIAYHYALLDLTPDTDCNFPGLVILDFPAELPDGSSVADKENFVIEPFISLLGKASMEMTQLIVAGSSFQNLGDARRIELRKIWK